MSNIVIEETGTIYAVKIMFGAHQSESGINNDDTRLMVGLHIRPSGSDHLPSFGVKEEIDNMNGFIVYGGVLNTVASGEGAGVDNVGHVNFQEKFRFRRKVDKDSVVEIFGQALVSNGTVRSIQVSGYWQLVLRTR